MKTNERNAMRGNGLAVTAALLLSATVGCSAAGGDGSADGGDPFGADGGDPSGGGGEGGTAGDPGVGPGVGQGGAQDFGQFRAILEAGDVPGPETLDDVGFFNEHKFALPAADCGDDVCLHASLGMMGNLLTGASCTMVMLGMNTPIDPAQLPRRPLNLAIAVDTSGSMGGEPISRVREGLLRMADALHPDDRVTLVSFADAAIVQAELTGADTAAYEVAVAQLTADGGTNVYEGLWAAYEAVEAHADPEHQNRVLLLSDGAATTGILGDDKIVDLAASVAADGVSLSTIGLGTSFDPVLMRRLSEVGGGSFYFIEDIAAVEEVFEEEVGAMFVPLAADVEIDLAVDAGWQISKVYGTKLADTLDKSTRIQIPILQLAHRESADDAELGRRGGGGVVLAEVMRAPGTAPPADGTVGAFSLRYEVPGTGEQVVSGGDVVSTDGPDANGYFSAPEAEKGFVMLNLFVAFQIAAERASVGDDTAALSALLSVRAGVGAWLATHDDFDITDDLRYVDLFIDNLRARGAAEPPPNANPPEPWPVD